MGNKINRIGEESINNFGSKMIITTYRKGNDIDVFFPEYDYTVMHKQYTHFKRGSISCPLENKKGKSRNKVNGDKIAWKEKDNLIYYNLEKLNEFIKNNIFDSKVDITKILGVNNNFLNNVEKIENIKFEYNIESKDSNSIYFKSIYQDYDWCYKKYVIEGLNHDEMAKEANCEKRVIEKWCQEKYRLTQKFRQENKKLNDIQIYLILGSILGDGHIDKRETQPLFIVSHAENQKDYLFWKYEILKDLCNKEPSYINKSVKCFKGKECLTQPSYRVCTRIYDCLKPYREMNYKEIISKLNEFSLSIYLLDDGCRSKKRWQLCVAELNEEEKEFFINIVKIRFNLECTIYNYDKRYINFNSDSSRKIDKIILNNIPNNLDIIKYKILEKDKRGIADE